MPVWCARGQAQVAARFTALPETSAAARTMMDVASGIDRSAARETWRGKVTLGLIDLGFLMGTSTAVHELGHARQVRLLGGESHWETGDVNWWRYVLRRQPLASGETNWRIPRIISPEERLRIAAGGFNATTLWDEHAAGGGPLGLFAARYSTLLYELSGVNRDADDLQEVERLYAARGFGISRREMQGWQLLAGLLSHLNSSVRAYAYYTSSGVSLKGVCRREDWLLGAEVVVHGDFRAEMEIGRRVPVGTMAELYPTVMVSRSGMGGSLKAGVRLGRARLSVDCQWVNPGSLSGGRMETRYGVEFVSSL